MTCCGPLGSGAAGAGAGLGVDTAARLGDLMTSWAP